MSADTVNMLDQCSGCGRTPFIELTDSEGREKRTCRCGDSIEVPGEPRFQATNAAVTEWRARHTTCLQSTDSEGSR